MKYNGIDVSKWQGRIDWDLVKSDGVQFAMIRSSFGWGKDNVDVLFETPKGSTQQGYTANYTPVFVHHETNLCGKILSVKLTDIHNDGLFGIIEQKS